MPDEPKYNHREAFCLMQYQDKVTGEIELLWNSRDGVTPFGIRSRAGNESLHVNWGQDKRDPHFRPSPGMRIFVDASPKHGHIRDSARDYVDRGWDAKSFPMSARWPDKDAAVEFFINEWTKPGTPTVIEAEP
jgi:hypothetical protein